MDNTRTADAFSQLSQEKILKIMNMVKNKEVSIEGALHLAQKEVCAEKDPQDSLTGSQFNFIIYKYKHYRWQKRILQLDFNTRTIFNIEKGIIKKQFPFSQVKGCEDAERRRFSIVFHGRQDYELEAVSLDDKRKIIYLLSRVIQRNSCKRPVESCPGRPAECDVIHEGLLDLQQNTATSTEWVKCLAQLREGELALYGLGTAPATATIPLAAGNVGISRDSGCSTFSLHTRDHHYLFRLPLSVQNSGAEGAGRLREWLALLEGHSQPGSAAPRPLQAPPACSSPEADYEEFLPCSLSAAAKRTKAFHWDVVPCDKIQKSVWGSCDPCKRKIDVCRLCEQFQIQDTAVLLGSEPAVNQHILLDRKVAHNFNIFLKSFRIKPSELKDKLFIIHEESGGLTDEQITALRRYLPTPKDAERYLSFKGSCSELHVVDQFMLEMCKIPQLGQRLDLLLSVRELPESIRDLEPLIIQNIQASKQLQSSPKFVAVLEYILAMGNHLNEKAGKEVAKGFRLSSLAKLPLLRGRERMFTLLHALVEQILSHEPELATFPQELTEFEAVPDASMKGLSAEVDVLKKELENLIQCRRLLKPKSSKATPQESQFSKELKDLIQKYEGDLSQLSKRCEEMKKLYSNVLVRFGEPPDLDSQELFGWISAFISEFRKACTEVTL
ncbi:PREDICTED: formin-F-like [Sturnus vulgaris]|uniref:formin-F-like n=1 Tax=Sturnus vulgaris TaxID=9172 RepID=UPI00071AA13C|nr:PREDICTED: formin-F-like [Sturnus vulgaris]